jgi:hypothetical protein
MRRGQESPWLKFMENKGRSLIEWSENYPAGQLTMIKCLFKVDIQAKIG